MINFGEIRVLVVDDMEDMRNIIRRLLNAMGFSKITLARNGEEALGLLRGSSFDIVLCDWNMPKMSGRELLEQVRSDPKLLLLPFIMITGENASTQVQSAVAGGVTDFIVKPFSAVRLEQRLNQVLRNAPLLSVLPSKP